MEQPTQIDATYVNERIALLTLFSTLFAVFAFQNYIRVFRISPTQPFFDHRNVKCIAHLSGTSAAFWATIA